jgi:hypothetical protein
MVPNAAAQDPFTWEEGIEPQEIAGFPLIPVSDIETMDVIVDSDIPITIFIIDTLNFYEDLTDPAFEDIENFTDYVQKYEDETHKEIKQDYDQDKSYWVVMYNPSNTETAQVTVEWEFWEDIDEEIIWDSVSGNCCCSLTMAVGLIGTIGLIATVLIARKRR